MNRVILTRSHLYLLISDTQECESGLVCRPTTNSTVPVCASRGTDGETCGSSGADDCADGLSCIESSQSPDSFVCKDTSGLEAGAACTTDDQCGVDSRGFSAQTQLKCLPKGDSQACQFESGLFGPCGDESNSACADGFTCDSTTSFCVVA